VLVPARLFVMRSREAKYPQHVLSLVSTKLEFTAEARTIALPVVRICCVTATAAMSQDFVWEYTSFTCMSIHSHDASS
jgi:hypothetical protein